MSSVGIVIEVIVGKMILSIVATACCVLHAAPCVVTHHHLCLVHGSPWLCSCTIAINVSRRQTLSGDVLQGSFAIF